jgi:hypothetical protein
MPSSNQLLGAAAVVVGATAWWVIYERSKSTPKKLVDSAEKYKMEARQALGDNSLGTEAARRYAEAKEKTRA